MNLRFAFVALCAVAIGACAPAAINNATVSEEATGTSSPPALDANKPGGGEAEDSPFDGADVLADGDSSDDPLVQMLIDGGLRCGERNNLLGIDGELNGSDGRLTYVCAYYDSQAPEGKQGSSVLNYSIVFPDSPIEDLDEESFCLTLDLTANYLGDTYSSAYGLVPDPNLGNILVGDDWMAYGWDKEGNPSLIRRLATALKELDPVILGPDWWRVRCPGGI